MYWRLPPYLRTILPKYVAFFWHTVHVQGAAFNLGLTLGYVYGLISHFIDKTYFSNLVDETILRHIGFCIIFVKSISHPWEHAKVSKAPRNMKNAIFWVIVTLTLQSFSRLVLCSITRWMLCNFVEAAFLKHIDLYKGSWEMTQSFAIAPNRALMQKIKNGPGKILTLNWSNHLK